MLQGYFETITDVRQSWKIRHNLHEVIIMTICAVIAECEAWYQIEHYCKSKKAWFKEKLNLKLKNGIPSHDTFERLFAMINPKELEASFQLWISETVRLTKGETVSIDGKTICASKDDENRAIHMVSAWANKQRLVLGQIKTDEKSNEITAVPQLLDMLEVEGCVITADAMSCQKDITRKITAKKADYVLGLKGNQESLHEDVKLYFDNISVTSKVTTKEKGHGRIETREYFLETDIDWLLQKPDWVNLNAIGMVKSKILEKGMYREETRYLLTSLTDVKAFAKATREHLGIENSLHWVLDVAFNEDRCRMRKDNSGENFAVICHIALNLLKKDDSKMSLKAKRHRCAYDDDFLFHILFDSI
ncbi:MAG: ISAs1 family transposase [Oscillospiraceae bacterium]|jgi:predicted transposase YbfD/YdcC|nr:ISAs1 family transposase [Oscillospiraceae bacterium]